MGDLRFVAIDENGKEVTIDDLFGFFIALFGRAPARKRGHRTQLGNEQAHRRGIRGHSRCVSAPKRSVWNQPTSPSPSVEWDLPPLWPITALSPSPDRQGAVKFSTTHAPAFGRARDPHTTSHISHIASLPPDEAARHMCHRLHLGAVDKIKMRALSSIMADAPSNLAKARASTSPFMVTANATKRAHTASRYVESQPGRLIHLDIAGPLLESRIGRYSLPDAPPRRLHSFPGGDPHAITRGGQRQDPRFCLALQCASRRLWGAHRARRLAPI